MWLGAQFPSLPHKGDAFVFSYQGAIWRVARQGGAATQLTDAEGFEIQPVWSPEHELVASIRGTGSFSGRFCAVRADSGQVVELPREVVAKDRLFFDP